MSHSLKKILAWVTDHKRIVTTVGVIIAALFFCALYTLQNPLRNWSKSQPSQRTTYGSESTQAQPTLPNQPSVVAQHQGDAETQSAPFGPDDPRVAVISAPETQQLIFNVECVVDLAQAHEQLLKEYTALYSLITDQHIQDVLYQRIKNQQAFRYPELSIKWHEFSESGNFNPAKNLGSNYMLLRAKQIRYRIVGGKITVGDTRFALWAGDYLKADMLTIAGYMENAHQLFGWLVADQVLSAAVAPPTSINTVADMQAGINQIISRNSVKPNGTASGSIDMQHEGSPLLVEASLTPEQRSALFASLDHLAIYLTKDLRFTPKLPAVGAGQIHQTASMIANPRYHPPLLPPLLITGKYRSQGFQNTWELFRSTLESTHPADAFELTQSYKSILAMHEESTSTQILPLLNSMADRNITGAPITVAELNQINAAEAWLNLTLANHEQIEQSMDALLYRLRTHAVPEIRKVFMPFVSAKGGYTGGEFVSIIDPFSREPMQPYMFPSIQRKSFNERPPYSVSGLEFEVQPRANDWTGAYVPELQICSSYSFISRPTKKPSPPVDRAPMRDIVRSQPAKITADQRNVALAALDRLALNISPTIHFLKSSPSTAPSHDSAAIPLLESQRDVLLMRRAACRHIAWAVVQNISKQPRAVAEPDLTYCAERFSEVLLSVMPYDDDDLSRLKDKLADISRRQAAGEPLSAGDVHDIDVWIAWLDAVSVEFHKQSDLIDTLIARVRKLPLPYVTILVALYAIDSSVPPPPGKTWAVDPFSDHPMEPFLANSTERINNEFKGELIYFDVAALNLQIKMGGM